ncbi:MAG TPA: CBS domain-containing protein [Steroidobacteraceae bacterium]|nr:CBS domain-containing protein [Steroidobacteraceae bacterium]
MQVNEIMSRNVQTCRPDDSLEHAARLMWDYDCGCLPVCESNGPQRVVGIITDRDICMGALFQGKPLRDLLVRDSMARQLVTCQATQPLTRAESTMKSARIRRLPVVDDEGALIGMLSLADFAREAAAQQSQTGQRAITEVEVNDTLACICEPVTQPRGSSVFLSA